MDTVRALALALDIHLAVLFAEEDVHVFDMARLRAGYRDVADLNDTLYRALGEVVRFGRGIGFLE